PPSVASNALIQIAGRLTSLESDSAIRWVSDEAEDRPTEKDPTYRISWNGKEWILERIPGGEKAISLGSVPEAADVKKHLPTGAKVIVQLPPTTELAAGLSFGSAGNRRIELMKTPAGATYVLHGRLNKGTAQYAWTLRDASAAQSSGALDRM